MKQKIARWIFSFGVAVMIAMVLFFVVTMLYENPAGAILPTIAVIFGAMIWAIENLD